MTEDPELEEVDWLEPVSANSNNLFTFLSAPIRAQGSSPPMNIPTTKKASGSSNLTLVDKAIREQVLDTLITQLLSPSKGQTAKSLAVQLGQRGFESVRKKLVNQCLSELKNKGLVTSMLQSPGPGMTPIPHWLLALRHEAKEPKRPLGLAPQATTVQGFRPIELPARRTSPEVTIALLGPGQLTRQASHANGISTSRPNSPQEKQAWKPDSGVSGLSDALQRGLQKADALQRGLQKAEQKKNLPLHNFDYGGDEMQLFVPQTKAAGKRSQVAKVLSPRTSPKHQEPPQMTVLMIDLANVHDVLHQVVRTHVPGTEAARDLLLFAYYPSAYNGYGIGSGQEECKRAQVKLTGVPDGDALILQMTWDVCFLSAQPIRLIVVTKTKKLYHLKHLTSSTSIRQLHFTADWATTKALVFPQARVPEGQARTSPIAT